MRIPALFGLATVSMLMSCASSGASGSARRSPDQVSSAEIATTTANNAYELINRLRPTWLRPSSTGSIAGVRSQVVVVYLDGNRLGDLQSLQTLSTTGIRSMQWLDAAKAAALLNEVGSDPIRGAILIKTH